MRHKILASAIALAAVAAAPAVAQTAAPAVTAGAQVKDTQGGVVGTVASVNGGTVVVKTGKHEIGLPAASFAKADNGYVIAMTQVQLDTAYEQAMAQSEALVKVGATVHGTDGAALATISELDDQFATLQLSGTESKVRLARSALAPTPQGPMIGLTADQLKAQVGAAAPAAQ